MTFHIPCQPLKLKVTCMGRRLSTPRGLLLACHYYGRSRYNWSPRQDKAGRRILKNSFHAAAEAWGKIMSATQQGLAATMDLTDALVDSSGRRALTASAVGYAMDGFDLLILGFMLRAISADLQLTPPQAGSLITWTLIRAVI